MQDIIMRKVKFSKIEKIIQEPDKLNLRQTVNAYACLKAEGLSLGKGRDMIRPDIFLLLQESPPNHFFLLILHRS